MDLEAAKLFSGNISRYTMIAALGCLLLAALILVTVSLSTNEILGNEIAFKQSVSKIPASGLTTETN